MNIALLRQVQAHIMEEPRRLNMDVMLIRDAASRYDILPDLVPPCNTVGCIAGWASTLAAGRFEAGTWDGGQEALGLNSEEASRLFMEPKHVTTYKYETGWPAHYANAYMAAETPLERAQVTCARIAHFIETDGEE